MKKKNKISNINNLISYFNFLKNSSNIKQVYLKSIVSKNYILIPVSSKITEYQLGELIKKFKEKKIILSKKIFQNNYKEQIGFLVLDKNGLSKGILKLKKIINESKINIQYQFLKEVNKENLKIETINRILNWCSDILNIKKFEVDISNNLNDLNLFNHKFLKNKFIIFHKSKKKIEINNNITDNKFILTAGPSISELEKFNVYDAVENGWNKNWSNYLKKFEKKFSTKINRKYCIATSSCTGALQIALMALDIGPGDEVIVPDITWVSTASVVQAVGAKPVFADVKLQDWTIETKDLEKLINKKTKAIMPVHLYGMPANSEILKKISNKFKLKIIEDAAPAIGASYKKIACGNLGEFSAFSFQGAKLLVTGEGGMLTTNNYKLYKKALKISDFGRDPKKTFWINSPGVKYKMSNIQAALGLAQLSRLNEMIKMKRTIFSWYEKFLNENNCRLIREQKNSKSIYWMTSIILNKDYNREGLIKLLKLHNIDTRPCFPSISSYPIWKNKLTKKQSKHLKNSKFISKQGINLPSGVLLRENDIKKICDIINSYC
jgi:dTDP-4-amino-4,6-dideoxygalactose transaminase